MKKTIRYFLSLALVGLLALCVLPMAAAAATPAEEAAGLADTLNTTLADAKYGGGALTATYAPAGSTTVTITGGSEANPVAFTDDLPISIPAGVTVDWQAHVTKSVGGLLLYLSGAGNFKMTTGSLEASGMSSHTLSLEISGTVTISGNAKLSASGGSSTSYAIHNGSNGTLIISGGEVESLSSSTAIRNGGGGTVTVSGGTVTNSGDNYAIHNPGYGTVNVTGGTVSNTGGTCAIYNEGSDNQASAAVVVSGGVVTASSGDAIRNDGRGAVTISGGEVSTTAGTGYAIRNKDTATVTVTNGTVSTTGSTSSAIFNESTSANAVTVEGGVVSSGTGSTSYAINNQSETGTVIVKGGEVKSIGGLGAAIYNKFTGTVAVEGGTVSASLYTSYAIHNNAAGTVNISGGVVYHSGSGSAAIQNTGGTLTVSGGLVFASNASAYSNSGSVSAVVQCPAGTDTWTPTDGGIVLAWNKPAAANPTYTEGDTTNLISLPANAEFSWGRALDDGTYIGGIAYGDGGFFPVAGVTVQPKTPTAADLDFTIPDNAVYTGSAQSLTVAAKSGVEGLGAITVKYNGSTTPPTNAGTYAVTADIAEGTNYAAATGIVLGEYTIGKADQKDLAVTVPSLQYGDAPVKVTVTGGDGDGALSYKITAGTGDASVSSDGYITPLKPGNFTLEVTKAGNENYNSASATASGTIVKATVTGVDQTVYVKAGQTCTYDLHALLPAGIDPARIRGHSYSLTSTESITGLDVNMIDAKTMQFKAGDVLTGTTSTYSINILSDYYVFLSPAILTVNLTTKTPVTIAVSSLSKVYDGKPVAPAVTVSSSAGELTPDEVAALGLVYSYKDSAGEALQEAPTDAGSYFVTISVPDGNALYVGTLTVPFTIEKRTLTITADNVSVTQGTTPTLTFSYDDFLKENPSLLEAPPTLTTTATAQSPAGTYDITFKTKAILATGANTNYTLTHQTGTLTITSSGDGGGGGGGGVTATTPSNSITAPTTDKGWTDAAEQVNDLKDGSTFTVDMKKNDTVSGDFLAAVAGKDVSIVFDMGGGMTWTVSGRDIPENTDLATLDLGLSTGTDIIPAAVRNLVGSLFEKQLRIDHNGDFDFKVALGVALDKAYAGKFANLFYFNPTTEALEFQSASKIAADGRAAFIFTHASDYLIVVAEESMEPTPEPGWENPFTDVKSSDWFYGDVQYAVENGLFTGTSDTTFAPNEGLTRGMLVTVLWRLEGSPDHGSSDFIDVSPGLYYDQPVAWAAAMGIVKGYEADNTFGPHHDITRQDFAVILERYMQYKELNFPVTMEYRIYADEAEISDYAKNAIQLMNKLGIINGVGENTINPQGVATRAEAAAMLHRFLELAAGQ